MMIARPSPTKVWSCWRKVWLSPLSFCYRLKKCSGLFVFLVTNYYRLEQLKAKDAATVPLKNSVGEVSHAIETAKPLQKES